MSSKALTDMQRRRNGLLVWHRLVKGHWMGCGDVNDDVVYEIKRDASNRPWRVIVDRNTTIDSGVRSLFAAQEQAQRHYSERAARKP